MRDFDNIRILKSLIINIRCLRDFLIQIDFYKTHRALLLLTSCSVTAIVIAGVIETVIETTVNPKVPVLSITTFCGPF